MSGALSIAVCDDETAIGTQIEDFIKEISCKLNVRFDVDVYFTGEELCKKMEDGVHYDLIFLDIELSKVSINGIEAGSRIRNVLGDNSVSIVYISWEQKYSMQLFDSRPLNFIIKPLTFERIEQVVNTYLKIAGAASGIFSYKTGFNVHRVKLKDIVYFESAGREVVLHRGDGSKERFYGSLKRLYEEQLAQHDFLHIHAAYIVNFDYVASFGYDKLVLTNDLELPISQARRKEIREAYFAAMERGRR